MIVVTALLRYNLWKKNSLCCELVTLPCVPANITHQCNPNSCVLDLIFNSYDVEVTFSPHGFLIWCIRRKGMLFQEAWDGGLRTNWTDTLWSKWLMLIWCFDVNKAHSLAMCYLLTQFGGRDERERLENLLYYFSSSLLMLFLNLVFCFDN